MGGATDRPVIVCDASVALAWLLEESAPAWVPGFWDAVACGRVGVTVPTLFWMEVGNRLVRRRDLADEQVMEGVIKLEWLAFETVQTDRSLRVMAMHLARQHRLSAYDALYLALAQVSEAQLATLDQRLGAAATAMGRRYGEVGGLATHEAPAEYGTNLPADPMSLAALGAYIAQLREQIPADD